MGATVTDAFEILGEKNADINILKDVGAVSELFIHVGVEQSSEADFSQEELETVKEGFDAKDYSVFPAEEADKYFIAFEIYGSEDEVEDTYEV